MSAPEITKEDVERLAKESGGLEYGPRTWNMTFKRDALHRFAKAVQEPSADLIARLVDCLDCAREDWEGNNGEIIDKTDPHWSVEARRLIAEATGKAVGEP